VSGCSRRCYEPPLRLIELIFNRPFAYAIAVPLLEILLERFGLGFPFRSVMNRNYEMITWTKSDPYAQAIVKVPIDADLLGKAQQEAAAGAKALHLSWEIRKRRPSESAFKSSARRCSRRSRA